MAAAQANNNEGRRSPAPTADDDHEAAAAAMVSCLPSREGWSGPLVLYKKYWLRPHFAENMERMQGIFKPRHDDTILASNPKCGTTWLKALAFAITTRSRYGLGSTDHPLLSTSHPQEVVPFIEAPAPGRGLAYVETLPSPRLLATHMPLSLLFPVGADSAGCRVVYVCREPKDAFVSRCHFENKIARGYSIDVEPALDMFVDGFSPYGPFWDHCLEYWRAASVDSPAAGACRVLFLKYDEMMAEPVKHVLRLAAFLGVPFSAHEQDDGVPEDVVSLCSFDTLSAARPTAGGGEPLRRNGRFVLDRSVFFRKGKVGDWVNHMTQEMGTKIDRVFEEKLKGSGLVL